MKTKISKSYNEQKKACFELMEELIQRNGDAGVDRLRLIYELTKLFAVGEVTISKRIDMLKDLNMVSETDGVLVWRIDNDNSNI